MSSLLVFTKRFLRPNLFKSLTTSKTHLNVNAFGVRYLFSSEFLGIDNYLTTRERIGTQFNQMRDKFFTRMEEQTNSESKMVFTEDLKNIIFLVDNNDSELTLMSDSIKKFHSQNQSLQFGTFVFGPIVMRILHHFSQMDVALSLFKDPELKGFFNQIKSVVILMNMLFINGRYEDVMNVLDFIQTEMLFEVKYPRDCLLLYMAAAYKLNTEQSLDKALEVLKNSREAGAIISRKTICLFAGLALNQKQPNIALEVLSTITQTNYISVRNLRLAALSDLKRFDDIFITLKLMLKMDVPPETRRPQILEETLKKIKSNVESVDDKQIETEFSQIERGLLEGNHMSSQTLEEVMLTPVVLRDDPNNQDNRGYRQQRGFRDSQNFRDRDQMNSQNFRDRDQMNSRNFRDRDQMNPQNFRDRDQMNPQNFRDRDPQNFRGIRRQNQRESNEEF